MSYYDLTDPMNQLMMDKKWDDVWTDCNIEDLNIWWNRFGRHCDHIKSKKTLQGIYVLAFDLLLFLLLLVY